MNYIQFITDQAKAELKHPDFQLLTFVDIPEFCSEMVFVTVTGQVFKGTCPTIKRQLTHKMCQKIANSIQSSSVALPDPPPLHTNVETISFHLSQYSDWDKIVEDLVNIWIWRFYMETRISQSPQSRQSKR